MQTISIPELSAYIGKDVCVQAQLIGRSKGKSDTGSNFLRLNLLEHGSCIEGIVWGNSPLYNFAAELDICAIQTIMVRGRIEGDYRSLRMRIQYIATDERCLDDSDACLMIPVQAHEAYEQLRAFMRPLKGSSLGYFMAGVFADTYIAPAFFQCRASADHHHNFPGGLLVHSVQVANLVQSQALCLKLSQEECQLGIVGALLHDLGKVETVGNANPRPRHPGLFKHEIITIKLLARHLQRLSQHDPKLGWTLEHMFQRMVPCTYEKYEQLILTTLISNADHASAAASNKKGINDFLSIGQHAQLHPKNQNAIPSTPRQWAAQTP